MNASSFTTLKVDPDGTTSVCVTLRPDAQISVQCRQDRPRVQLWISHGRADVTIVPSNPEAPTAEDVRVARQLAELFARYAAEVERLHTVSQSAAPAA
ncbi:hypothetical protein [Actinomadura welshii]|uniref:hypothetical protein n=1 Tax=Actinomadura welshii TaxID=3103817 RepID=UPI0003ACF5F1|nr:hypothetical protein [Actinomadura madurae]